MANSGSGQAGFARRSKSPSAIEQRRHLLVAQLRETGIELAHGVKKYRYVQANRFIHFPAQLLKCVFWCYRHGKHHPGWVATADSAQSGEHSGACCHTIIDDDGSAAVDIHWPTIAEINATTPLNLSQRPRLPLLQILRRNV